MINSRPLEKYAEKYASSGTLADLQLDSEVLMLVTYNKMELRKTTGFFQGNSLCLQIHT